MNTSKEREQLNELLDALSSFAKELLSKHSEFYPFSAYIENGGKLVMSSHYDGDDHPDSNKLIKFIVETFKGEAIAQKIIATGICTNVSLTKDGTKRDAIQFRLEHKEGESINVYIPYVISGEAIKYDKIFAEPKDREIFFKPESVSKKLLGFLRYKK